ncbi:MAG: transcriptional regulator [Chloroflexi bacterium AL-W]|nr:transcriptional regulator [Chloroflexi bacterium AL-N1]NOK71425.1 transcriptional regulator [Chloroflexi bacterium AL-N10]NOK78828.1 transcriptional regulator [Chloroflexi bacterium AL-N5]NOK86246.1 transcriptional regulator [Chloroflexi bacterium AL-W]NOK93150.1 transcriptional regulator [Chloroflexi bacterium AL-N15]
MLADVALAYHGFWVYTIHPMETNNDNHPIYDRRYPVRQVLDLIADKWTPIMLYCLSGGTRRFSELQHQIPDISKKMLIQVLRRLEHDGLVERKVYPVVPPKTEYSLTDLGRRLHEPIAMLCEWAIEHQETLDTVLQHRRHSADD